MGKLSAGECLLLLNLLRDITADFGKCENISCSIANRVDNDIGQKLATIFSDPPTLCLIAPLRACLLQSSHRNTGTPVFLGIDDRIVLTDRLVAAVALYTLRAGIPTYDVSVR